MSNIRFVFTETIETYYTFDIEELKEHYLANEPRTKNPSMNELYSYFQGDINNNDLRNFKSFTQTGSEIVGIRISEEKD